MNMEAKLIKRGENDYNLYVNGELYSTTDNSPYRKLSLKNCQAIECGYDLDELATEFAKTKTLHPIFQEKHKRGFIEGAKAILEILGNKKFSEEDVISAILFGQGMELWKEEEQTQRYVQSLQQTEWNVEPVCLTTQNSEHSTNTGIPKLDQNGCLILKRIK